MGAVREVYYKLLKVTRCKNCGKKLCQKVTMCESGHTVCENCYNSLVVCSKCDGEFFDRYHIVYNNVVSALNDRVNFLEKLCEILECPVCYDNLSCPSWTCWNGHLTCGRCFFYTSSCPLCREEFTNLYNTDINKLLNVLESPIECINRVHGCNRFERYAKLRKHETTCRFRQFCCRIGSCEWRGFLNKLSDHVLTNHPKDILKPNYSSIVDFEISTNDTTWMISNGSDSYWLESKMNSSGFIVSLTMMGFNPRSSSTNLQIHNTNYTIPIYSLQDSSPTSTLLDYSSKDATHFGKTVTCKLVLNSKNSSWLLNTMVGMAITINLTFAFFVLKESIR